MRKLFAVAVALLVFAETATVARASDFCAGFETGYAAGYCYGQSFCLKPLPPLCPLPGLGENTFQDGYNRGFLAGMAAKG